MIPLSKKASAVNKDFRNQGRGKHKFHSLACLFGVSNARVSVRLLRCIKERVQSALFDAS